MDSWHFASLRGWGMAGGHTSWFRWLLSGGILAFCVDQAADDILVEVRKFRAIAPDLRLWPR